jgi:hypothetical protein
MRVADLLASVLIDVRLLGSKIKIEFVDEMHANLPLFNRINIDPELHGKFSILSITLPSFMFKNNAVLFEK